MGLLWPRPRSALSQNFLEQSAMRPHNSGTAAANHSTRRGLFPAVRPGRWDEDERRGARPWRHGTPRVRANGFLPAPQSSKRRPVLSQCEARRSQHAW